MAFVADADIYVLIEEQAARTRLRLHASPQTSCERVDTARKAPQVHSSALDFLKKLLKS